MTTYVGTSGDDTLDLLTPFTNSSTVYSSIRTLDGKDTIFNYTEVGVYEFSGVAASVTNINTGNGDDIITLRQANNSTINGADGDDNFIISFTNNALILGGAGDDTFSSFNELVDYTGEVELSGTTNTQYRGGTGDDTFNLYQVSNANVSGGQDNDTIIANFGSENSFFKGDSGDDNFIIEGTNNIISGGNGADDITILNGYSASAAYGGNDDDYISREFAEILANPAEIVDVYSLPSDYSALTSLLNGGAGNDTIKGGHVANDLTIDVTSQETLIGGAGDDEVFAFGGDDSLYGQDGADLLDGGAGDDFISGGSGDDIIAGGFGDDKIFGGDGDDLVADISVDASEVDPNGGADRLYGDVGDDTLVSTGGEDRLHGGDGDDVFAFLPYDGLVDAVIEDFVQGEDTIFILEVNASGTVSFALDFSTLTIAESNGSTDIVFDNGSNINIANVTGITIADFFAV